ncbi:cell wall-binding repeat-containing protein [Bacillus sp. 2205SS5-2]|uniref:cell wall-binding repeat-containing protein n=1 Tax=Bacillus sp. 2205SS5-2 TaxID=3109031 RepID=UPI00300479EF
MLKKALSLVICSMVILLMLSPNNALAEGQPISVKLHNYVGNVSNISFNITGSYQVADTDVFIEPTDNYSVKVESGKLTLYKGSKVVKKFDQSLSLVPSVTNSRDSYVTLLDKYHTSYLGEVEFTVEYKQYVRPINHINLEDYLKGVVPAEMYASWGSNGGMEALKAQSVAARTYVLRKGAWTIDDTQSNQVYKGLKQGANTSVEMYKPYTNLSVNETQGEVLKSGSSYVNALYSSSNGGKILSNKNTWGTDLVSYFQTKTDPYDHKISPFLDWSYTIHKQQLNLEDLDLNKPETWWDQQKEKDATIISNIKSRLKSKNYISDTSEIKIVDITEISFDKQSTNFSSNDVLSGKISFTYLEKNKDAYSKDEDGKIELKQKTINDTAYNLRFMIGTSIMKSPYIKSVDNKDASNAFTIKGAGFGHGVGMSQYGAYQMSKEGHDFEKILNFYYPKTTVTRELDINNYSHSLQGKDRYETSTSVSSYGWENRSKAVIIGRGDLSIDALTGSVLAKKYNSPLLLTSSSNLPSSVLEELKRLQPENVYILGGVSAVSSKAENQIKELSFLNDQNIVRVSGADRYETAVKVANEINNTQEVFVVTKDEKSPDALSIASYASMMQIPILYTTKESLHESVSSYIQKHDINKVNIIGGTSAVSANVENQLKKLSTVVTRVSGKDRYETSMEIADQYSQIFEGNTLFFARGEVFIDALPASSLAATMKSPLILTQKDQLPSSVESWLNKRSTLPDVYFLGGSGAISNEVRENVMSVLTK